MLLSQLSEKPVVVSASMRGVCLGVGVSLKNFAVKYLLCASAQNRKQADFCVNFSAVECIDDALYLKALRPVFPRSCARFSLQIPVFSSDGGYLGKVADLELENGVATRFFTDNGKAFPLPAVLACTDAVILKKEQPFPLGQRVPAPLLSVISDKKEGLVTKPLLRAAREKSSLVKLTLSLPPFDVEFFPVMK